MMIRVMLPPRLFAIRTKKIIRRLYYHWARLITQYPVRIILTSILLTVLSAVSFLIKTPFTIGTLSTRSDDFHQNRPQSYVLQFAMFAVRFIVTECICISYIVCKN